MEQNITYSRAIAYLTELEVFGMKPGLERITALLDLLDHPERKYKTVHVTGTNGKGSVSVMLANILCESGVKIGLFTSPHLITYRERIQIDGVAIDEVDFAAAIGAVKSAADATVSKGGEPPTQFEVLTAAAFWYFAQKQVEYAIIEVGLGGLYDSTNVILPVLTIITNVTAEHIDKCGGTLAGVAMHKAGIIKPKVPLVTAAEDLPREIILAKAREFTADAYVYGRDFFSEVVEFGTQGQKINVVAPTLNLPSQNYELKMLGEHQAKNAAVAIVAAQLVSAADGRVDSKALRTGLTNAFWPGRLELIDYCGKKLLLDGAHNPAGVRSLRQALDAYFPAPARTFILGILRDKEIESMLKILLRPADTVIATRPVSPRAAEPEKIAAMARKFCVAEAIGSPLSALQTAIKADYDPIIVCGSLYLIGAVLDEVTQ